MVDGTCGVNCTSWRNKCETSRIKIKGSVAASVCWLFCFLLNLQRASNRAWRRNRLQMFQFEVSGVWHSNNTDLTSAWRQCFPTLQLPHLLLRWPPHPRQVCLLPARPLAEKEVKKKKNDISETAWHSQGETLIHRPYSKPSLSLFSKLSFFISLRWEEWEEGTSDKRAENGLFKQP